MAGWEVAKIIEVGVAGGGRKLIEMNLDQFETTHLISRDQRW